MKTAHAPAPTQEAELYASTNGMLSIRRLLPAGQLNNGHPYLSTDLGTTIADKGRKTFAKFLAKHAIKGIDPETAIIQSKLGPVTPEELKSFALGTIMRNRLRLHGGKKRSKAVPPMPRDKANGHTTAWQRSATPANTVSRAKDLIAVLGTSLASAATALRMLEEELGDGQNTE